MKHPITPPPELLKQWEDAWSEEREHADVLLVNAYAAGALAGADAELEACCELLNDFNTFHLRELLRAARRPKPPSLKEQALALINHDPANQPFLSDKGIDTIRRALEQLDD